LTERRTIVSQRSPQKQQQQQQQQQFVSSNCGLHPLSSTLQQSLSARCGSSSVDPEYLRKVLPPPPSEIDSVCDSVIGLDVSPLPSSSVAATAAAGESSVDVLPSDRDLNQNAKNVDDEQTGVVLVNRNLEDICDAANVSLWL
jgi:hypothetical protein